MARWFAELTDRTLRRSAHRSIAALEAGVKAWIAADSAGEDRRRPGQHRRIAARVVAVGDQIDQAARHGVRCSEKPPGVQP